MGGIAGKLASSMHASIDRDLLAAMAERVAHRGPDDARYYVGAGRAASARRA